MIVCVVGSGAREHALATVLSRTADVIVTPGNPGMPGSSLIGNSIVCTGAPAEEIDADLYVIGPEAPLVEGLSDRLRSAGKAVFGPSSAAARLEGSKAFMKELVARANVPTARFAVFDRGDEAIRFLDGLAPPYVVKTDGLASGKGVLVIADLDLAKQDVLDKLSGRSFGQAGTRVVIEEGLVGPELSLLVLCDGKALTALPPAQDYKRVGDADLGPNTGGMGAYSPVPIVSDAVIDDIMARIVAPTLDQLVREGIDYRGVLYAGCMLTSDGPKLIEYNVRFGDPEAEVVLPRLEGDVAELLRQVASGHLTMVPTVSNAAAVCVVLATRGYPESPVVGDRIHGLAEAGTVEGVTIFHGGVNVDDHGALVTASGRVLTVCATAPELESARDRAYRAAEMIQFSGMHYRSDIASFGATEARLVGDKGHRS